MGFTSETVAKAAAAYEAEREAEDKSRHNADLAHDLSVKQSLKGGTANSIADGDRRGGDGAG